MKVVIIGSLKSKEKIKQAERAFLEMGCSVFTPFDNDQQSQSLVEIQRHYYTQIKTADLVVAIPKLDAWASDEPGTQTENMVFGESTCYEIAIATMNAIPIVYWTNQGTLVFEKEV